MWNLLIASLDREEPFFQHARNTVLFPEVSGRSYVSVSSDTVEDLLDSDLRLRVGRLAVESLEVVLGEIRREWPLMGRLFSTGVHSDQIPVRVGLPFLLALLIDEECALTLEREREAVLLAAALELGAAASVCHAAVGRAGRQSLAGDWSDKLALMLGDYALGKAMNLSTRVPDETAVGHVLASFEDLAKWRLDAAARPWTSIVGSGFAKYCEWVTTTWGSTFAYAALVGATLVRAPSAKKTAEVARVVGTLWHLGDEFQALHGVSGGWNDTAGIDWGSRLVGAPLALAAELAPSLLEQAARFSRADDADFDCIREIVASDAAAAELDRYCQARMAEVKHLGDGLPESPGSRALLAIAFRAIERLQRSLLLPELSMCR
jgi:geranylgeranyl pyrophosphate synthase